jgi:hypothetical protein
MTASPSQFGALSKIFCTFTKAGILAETVIREVWKGQCERSG